MADAALVLVSAFGGELAGAVLQPATVWAFDLLRARDRRLKARQRRLRRMIESWLRYGTGVMTSAHTVAELRRHGISVPHDGLLRMIFRNQDAEHWIPALIEDVELRDAGNEYYDVLWELGAKVWDPSLAPEDLMSTVRQAGQLQGKVMTRMEDLAWPDLEG